MVILIYEISGPGDYSIQFQAFPHYGILDIPSEHSAFVPLLPLVPPDSPIPCIMSQRLHLSHTEQTFRHRLGHYGRITLHTIGLRKIPLEKYLQLPHPHKVCRICYDRCQKCPIPLVSPQLLLSVSFPCHIHRLKLYCIILDPHSRADLKLPP